MITFISLIESMGSPYPFHIEHKDAMSATYVVDDGENGDQQWVIIAHKEPTANNIGMSVDIMFASRSKDNPKKFNMMQRVNVGNPFRLFATILHIIDTVYADVPLISFSTLEYDRAKDAVYDRLSKVIARNQNRSIVNIRLQEQELLGF